MSSRAPGLVITLALLAGLPGSGWAATDLGDQRSGTSSGTFLKIPVDPRGTALGGAFVAGADGVGAMSWNPAGLTSVDEIELMFSYVRWPAEIDYTYFGAASYLGRVNGSMGLQIGYLGTVMEETTEENPYGTGRTFGFRDWYVGLTYARRFTDQLSFGITGRYVREDLGTEVGGPSTNAVLLDVGTLYYLRTLNLAIGFSLQNFGPGFQPSGSYDSAATGEETSYEQFSPPTTFRLGIMGRLLRGEHTELRGYSELNHYSDAAETVKLGSELEMAETLFFRAGYDLTADAMKFSAGVGLRTRFGFNTGDVDYAYTAAGPLGDVHRLSVRIRL